MSLHFPVPEWTRQSYKESFRQFGWPRNGRAHAGCDVYAPVGSPVIAVADGTVQVVAGFYRNTNYIAVLHPGIGVVRYCEILSIPKNFKAGAPVVAGETLGLIGKMAGIANTMLHIEVYSGSGTGPLTVDSTTTQYLYVPQAVYKRRADLMNPYGLLDRALAVGAG